MRSILRVGFLSNDSSPATAEPKVRRQNSRRSGIIALLFLGLLFQARTTLAQVSAEPCPNCTAEDIKVVSLSLTGYSASPCPDSGEALVGAYIQVNLNVTAKQRYGLLFVGNLYVNDQFVKVVDSCYKETFDQGPVSKQLFIPGITYTAGTKYEIRNVMTAWDNNKPRNGIYNPCNGYSDLGDNNEATNEFYCKAFAGTGLTPKCKYYAGFTFQQPAKPSITELSITDVSCYGGSNGAINISVSPTSQSPYTYAWSKTGGGFSASTKNVNGLTAGEYTVVVTFNGCTASKTFTVDTPTELTADTSKTDALCNGANNGTATVTPSGGTPSYTYSWNTTPTQTTSTATGLAAGTYTCTITDANGCTLNKSVTVGQPSSLSASITAQTNVSCNGGDDGSATVTGSGGKTPYSYSWNTTPSQSTQTATDLTAGSYIATVTDANSCSTTATATITEPTAISVSAEAAESTICEGSTTTVTVTASGGTGTLEYKLDGGSYQSSNTFTNVGVGPHTVTVRDANHCTNDDHFTINGKECNRFCTYTQGYFGNEGGKSSFDTGAGCQQQQSTRTAIQTALNWWSSRGGLKIGNITVTSVDAVLNYLPGGGPSENYGGSTLSGAAPNTLLAQTLTLGLNIGLNQYLAGYNFEGHIYAQKTDGSCGQGNVSSGCKSYSFGAPYDNMTVREIFEAAGQALKEGNATERSTLAGIAGAINESFDECAKAVPSCPAITGTKASSRLSGETQENALIPENLLVRAYPNPFTNQVFLNIVAPVSGTALIEFFDLSGRKLEIIQRSMEAGQEILIDFNATKAGRSHLFYKVTLGAFSQNGKLFYSGKH